MRRKIIRTALVTVLLSVLLFSGGMMLRERHLQEKAIQNHQKLQQMLQAATGEATTAPSGGESTTKTPEAVTPAVTEALTNEHGSPITEDGMLLKFQPLVDANPHTLGWLTIPGTDIDYVVMQSKDKPERYLGRDFFGEKSKSGELFMDAKCDVDTSDNLIIYGHYMKNGTMFGKLDVYKDESFWQDHRYIAFDTLYEEGVWEVVAAFYTRVLYQNEEGFRYYQYTGDNDKKFQQYKDFIADNRLYDTGVTLEEGDQILTLSTCAYQTENGRFAVVAKKVKDWKN